MVSPSESAPRTADAARGAPSSAGSRRAGRCEGKALSWLQSRNGWNESTGRSLAGSAVRKDRRIASEAWNSPWNRQGEGRAPPEPIRPPDGTRRRRELPVEGCRFADGRKAGSGWNGQTDCNDRAPEMEQGFTPQSIRPDATSITMRSTPGAHCTRGCSVSITAAKHVCQAGKRQPPIRPETAQAIVGPAAMPAPFTFGCATQAAIPSGSPSPKS